MPTFETPQPISATVGIVVGDVRITAGERGATVVEVRPSDPSNDEDVRAADQTRVECADGHLLVKAPKLRSWSIRSHGGSIDVTIELPAGSELRATGQMADFECAGALGECRIRNGIGTLRLEQTANLSVKSGAGDIEVERVRGAAEIATGSGDVRVRELGASAVIKNSNGDTWVGVAGGDLRLNSANGSIAIDRAHRTVVAKTANGDVRLGDARGGTAVLETQVGDVEIGIPEGTAAWLDVSATAGRVHNALETAGAPAKSADTVEVRARTSLGNVEIRRAR